MTKKDVLLYEITGSWWASFVSWGVLQELVARYMAVKVRRKYRRYQQHLEFTRTHSPGKVQNEQERYDKLLARYTKRWGEHRARGVLRSFFNMEDPRIKPSCTPGKGDRSSG